MSRMSFPVTHQLVVNCHPGACHLFERDDVSTIPPALGMLLVNYGGPNVMGTDAGFENLVRRVAYDAKRGRALLALHGYRAPTDTFNEVVADLNRAHLNLEHAWRHCRKLADDTPDEQTDPMEPP